MADDDDMNEPSELEPPEGILGAEQAVEVLRAWIADGSLHVTFDPETFSDDVSEWGRLLSDIAVHVANAVALDGQMSFQEALTSVHQAYDKGVSTHHPEIIGKIIGRPTH
jgi:hypothetical protein